jgi:hypothetical protein
MLQKIKWKIISWLITKEIQNFLKGDYNMKVSVSINGFKENNTFSGAKELGGLDFSVETTTEETLACIADSKERFYHLFPENGFEQYCETLATGLEIIADRATDWVDKFEKKKAARNEVEA